MEVNADTGRPGGATRPRGRPAATPAATAPATGRRWSAVAAAESPIVVPNTLWQAADPTAYGGGRPPTITHLAELELQDKGDNGRWGALDVIPTTADYLLDYLRMNSLWPLLSGLACCAMEMMSAATSVNDMDRFNMFPFRASPRQADVLIVAGTLTTKMAGPLVRLWEQMPEPKWCVAMGDCTCSGGRYKRSYATVEGIDRVMPVDVYVPGLPAAPGGPHLRHAQAPAAHPGAARHSGPSDGSAPPSRLASDARPVTAKRHRRRTPRCKRRLTERLGDAAAGARRARATTRPSSSSARAQLTHVMTHRSTTTPTSASSCSPTSRAWTRAASLQVVYHLWSPLSPDWLRVICDGLPRDDPRLPSVTFLWNGAEWAEREAYDMFGIIFEGNRDLRRIYMPPDYQSFPLRKDFLLPDDASRSPGLGVRHMEQALPTGESRPHGRCSGAAPARAASSTGPAADARRPGTTAARRAARGR